MDFVVTGFWASWSSLQYWASLEIWQAVPYAHLFSFSQHFLGSVLDQIRQLIVHHTPTLLCKHKFSPEGRQGCDLRGEVIFSSHCWTNTTTESPAAVWLKLSGPSKLPQYVNCSGPRRKRKEAPLMHGIYQERVADCQGSFALSDQSWREGPEGGWLKCRQVGIAITSSCVNYNFTMFRALHLSD